jgi:hypothetical protein
MIQTFIEQNRRMLLFYYWAAKIVGWICLSFSLLQIAGFVHLILITRINDWTEFWHYYVRYQPWGTINDLLLPSLLVLGFAQLIWYLLATDHKPGWLLRNADKLLYTYFAISIGNYCLVIYEIILHYDEPYDYLLNVIYIMLFFLIKLLVVVGLAQTLKRLLPIIEESRTLV